MTQELIYTSAPKGLKLGSRGFCTVACTPGMAKPLADRLEALSGYRHLYQPGSPDAVKNPANFSFVTFKLGGKTHYVLSRVGDAGLDHTQRSNKIAHHVVLDSRELVAAGPAWLLLQPGLVANAWDGEPRLLPATKSIPQGDLSIAPCTSWKQATGDAGWAGVLAETVEDGTHSIAYVIYPHGTDVLRLVAEAQALLSPSKRWGATFSTFWCKLPPGVECRWRFVPEGTQESLLAARSPEAQLIDISNEKLPRPRGVLVEAARSGDLVTKSLSVHEAGLVSAESSAVHASSPEGASNAEPAPIFAPLSDDSRTVPPLLPPSSQPRKLTSTQPNRVDGSRSRFLAIFIATTAILALIGGLGFWFLIERMISGTDGESSSDPSAREHVVVPESQTGSDKQNGADPAEPSKSSEGANESRSFPDSGVSPMQGQPAIQPATTQGVPPQPVSDASSPSTEDASTTSDELPQVEIDCKSWYSLPSAPSGGSGLSTSGESVPLVTISGSSISHSRIDLTILGANDAVRLNEDPSARNRWDFIDSQNLAIASLSLVEDPSSQGSRLYFSWNEPAERNHDAAEAVMWCGINIVTNGATCNFALFPAEHTKSSPLPIVGLVAKPLNHNQLSNINEVLRAIPNYQQVDIRWQLLSPSPPHQPLAVNRHVTLARAVRGHQETRDLVALLRLSAPPKRELHFEFGASNPSASSLGGGVQPLEDYEETVIGLAKDDLEAFFEVYAAYLRSNRLDGQVPKSRRYATMRDSLLTLKEIPRPRGILSEQREKRVADMDTARRKLTLLIEHIEKVAALRAGEDELGIGIEIVRTLNEPSGHELRTRIVEMPAR